MHIHKKKYTRTIQKAMKVVDISCKNVTQGNGCRRRGDRPKNVDESLIKQISDKF